MVSKTMPRGCKMKGQGYCPRPIECAASFLSKKWTLSLLITIGNFDTVRFNHLLDRIEGITPKILSSRLGELEKHNLLDRSVYYEKPPRVEYGLTKGGKALYKALVPLMRWAEKYDK